MPIINELFTFSLFIHITESSAESPRLKTGLVSATGKTLAKSFGKFSFTEVAAQEISEGIIELIRIKFIFINLLLH